MITGSALPRLLNCPASEVLPKAQSSNEFAAAGQDEHEELARQTLGGDLPGHLARWVPPAPRVEVKLRYNAATREAAILGDGADRNYGAPSPFDIFMSLDVIGVDGDSAIVLDWKTGAQSVESARTNGQLWGGALAVCRALGKSKAIVRIVYTNQGGRCDEHEIDALDLADFAGRLERLHVTVTRLQEQYRNGGILDTHEGSWCRYCPAVVSCPAKRALIVQMAERGLAVVGDTQLTPERAKRGYDEIVRVEQLVRDARKRLETYVEDNGPIDLGNGKMFGRYVRQGNERLSGDVAVKAIAQVVGEAAEEFAAVAIERKTTKAAIERAAKQVASGRRGLAVAVIKKIRELGGATNGPDSMPIGEYVKDDNEPAPTAIDYDELDKLLA